MHEVNVLPSRLHANAHDAALHWNSIVAAVIAVAAGGAIVIVTSGPGPEGWSLPQAVSTTTSAAASART